MRKLNHLEEIYSDYDTFIIDLWGVMHNGIKLYNKASSAIEELSKKNKKIVFLSNAPRPSSNVKEFLKNLKMDDKFLKNVITSGEIAMNSINQNKFGKFFFHLGPPRDEPIFSKVKNNKSKLNDSDFILCTGLFDEHQNDLKYYENLLKDSIAKKLICTNPDLIVHRDNVKEYCAGKIAQVFETLGGKSIYFGKPHKEIYKECFSDKEKALAIGDNLRTDIKGANNMRIDSIFITNGIHRDELKSENNLSNILNDYQVKTTYFQNELEW